MADTFVGSLGGNQTVANMYRVHKARTGNRSGPKWLLFDLSAEKSKGNILGQFTHGPILIISDTRILWGKYSRN